MVQERALAIVGAYLPGIVPGVARRDSLTMSNRSSCHLGCSDSDHHCLALDNAVNKSSAIRSGPLLVVIL